MCFDLSEYQKCPRHAQILKMVMIGESGTGKTSLLLRFADDSFSQSQRSTIGVDFKIKSLTVDGYPVKLQMWDTAGQERFRSMSTTYFRNSQGCMAVYDITCRSSFRALEQLIDTYLSF